MKQEKKNERRIQHKSINQLLKIENMMVATYEIGVDAVNEINWNQ